VIGSLRRYEIPFDESETTEALREKLAEFYARRTITRETDPARHCANAILWLAGDQSAKTTVTSFRWTAGCPKPFSGKGDTRRTLACTIRPARIQDSAPVCHAVFTIRAVQQLRRRASSLRAPLRDSRTQFGLLHDCSPAAVHRVSIDDRPGETRLGERSSTSC